MKKLILFSCFVFALTLALTACSNSDDEIVTKSDLTSEDLAWNNRKDAKARLPYGVNGIMQTASVSLTPKSGLPAWIVPIVNQFEKDDPMKYTALFSCQWDGRTVYFIYSLIQSSLFSETYDISGEKIQVWGEGIGTMEDFMRTSTDWKLLYCTDVSKWIVTTLGEWANTECQTLCDPNPQDILNGNFSASTEDELVNALNEAIVDASSENGLHADPYIIDIETALDWGLIVVTDIYVESESFSHSVTIIGYNDDGYIAYNTDVRYRCYTIITSEQIKGTYCVGLRKKNKLD